MAPMFCTVKQAADKLGTTEAQIRRMLDSGTLREFRDGPRRLLKLADLTDVEIVQRPGSCCESQTPAPRKAKTPQPGSGRSSAVSPNPGTAGQPSAGEIKLPPTAAASKAARPSLRPPKPVSRLPRHAATSKPAPLDSAHVVVVAPPEIEGPAASEPHEEFSTEDLAYSSDAGAMDRGPQSACPSHSGSLPVRPSARPVVHRPAARPPLPSPRRPYTHTMSLRQWLWLGLLDDQPFAIVLLFGLTSLALGAVAGVVYLLSQAF